MAVTVAGIGDGEYLITVTEAGVGPATAIRIDLPFRKGRIMRAKGIGSNAGIGSIEFLLSRKSTDTGGSLGVEFRALPIGDDASPALPLVVDEQPNDPILFFAASDELPHLGTGKGRLWFRPQPDVVGATIEAEFLVRAGWPGFNPQRRRWDTQ